MAIGVYGRWWTRLTLLLSVAILGLLAACGSDAPTAVSRQKIVAAPLVSLIATPTPSSLISPASGTDEPRPTEIQSLPAPDPTAPPAFTAPPLTAALQLDVTSPDEDTVIKLSSIKGDGFPIAGIVSPDATVSVNGILAIPDERGNFSVELPLTVADNPLAIEVIATSVAGEQNSVVRTVIFLP